MSKKDGGPAFPCAGHENGMEFDRGLSLRDYFAAKALEGQLSTLSGNADGLHAAMKKAGVSHVHELLAKNAYDMADAMLAERDK